MAKKTLEYLVNDYLVRWAHYRQREISFYRKGKNNPDFIDAIYKAGQFLEQEEKLHNHQRRIKRSAKAEFQQALTSIQSSQFNNFDELYETIKGLRVKGIGPLTIFDTALRLGSFLGLEPNVVYLHQGAAKGYSNLFKTKIIPRTVETEDLPPSLRTLSPHQIENFLCLYKGDFLNDATSSDKRRC